jgi:hypothetical protein
MAKKPSKPAPRRKPNNILVRDRDGVFYEIPVTSAKKYALAGRALQGALEYYQEVDGGGPWAKMSW